MTPRVTGVREQNALGPNGVITKVIVLTYMVGAFGPFTLTTNQVDINSGAAQQAMQGFANSLGMLPVAPSS